MKITETQLRKIVKEQLRYDFGSGQGDAVIAKHSNKAELKALSAAFTYQVTPEDIPYIVYQSRKSGGMVTRLDLEDQDGRLGNMQTSLNEKEANHYKTTVAKVMDFLSTNGGSRKKRAAPRRRGAGHSFSYYD